MFGIVLGKFLDYAGEGPVCLTDRLPPCPIFHVSHHIAHIVASWMFREKEYKEPVLYLALDGGGPTTNPAEISFYSAGLISDSSLTEMEHIGEKLRYSSYARLCDLGPVGSDPLAFPGKLMGMAGFVPRDAVHEMTWPKDFNAAEKEKLRERHRREGLTPAVMASFASFYLGYLNDIKQYITAVCSRLPVTSTVVVGGGTFLALELNNFLRGMNKEVIFGPGIDDSGQCLGSAAYGYFSHTGRWPKPLSSPFIQWRPPVTQPPIYLSPAEAAECLLRDNVLAVLHGSGELGPRALGHRSFLARPSIAMAQRVSGAIKKREHYRPLAPVVTDRDFNKLFLGPRGHYMQYANRCTPEARKLTPGIVHRDDTARVQVLREQDDPWLYELLTLVGRATGAECLSNTSLNAPGKPICNTLEDFRREIFEFPDVVPVCFD
jgi:carbamoyltransferase